MAVSLTHSLDHERELGNIQGINIAKVAKEINHPQFFDDTLFMGKNQP